MNDRASGVFNMSQAIGCIIAPILGGILNDKYGFRLTCDIMGCWAMGFAVLYFLIVVVPHILFPNNGQKIGKARKVSEDRTDEENQNKISEGETKKETIDTMV